MPRLAVYYDAGSAVNLGATIGLLGQQVTGLQASLGGQNGRKLLQSSESPSVKYHVCAYEMASMAQS